MCVWHLKRVSREVSRPDLVYIYSVELVSIVEKSSCQEAGETSTLDL